MANDRKECTDKQKAFVHEYIDNGFNATKAYETVYNAGSNSQVNRNAACQLLKNERVKDYLNSVILSLQEDTRIQSEKIKNILYKRLEKAISEDNDILIIKLTDQINRMNAAYINVNQNTDTKTVNINNIDIDTLKRLSDDL